MINKKRGQCSICHRWFFLKDMAQTLIIYEIKGGAPVRTRKNGAWVWRSELFIQKVFGMESYLCPDCFDKIKKNRLYGDYQREIKKYISLEVELISKEPRKYLPRLFDVYYKLLGDIKKIFSSLLQKELEKVRKGEKEVPSFGERNVLFNRTIKPILKKKYGKNYGNVPSAYYRSAFDVVRESFESWCKKKEYWNRFPIFRDIPVRLYVCKIKGGNESLRIEKKKVGYIAKIKTVGRKNKREFIWVTSRIFTNRKGFSELIKNRKITGGNLVRRKGKNILIINVAEENKKIFFSLAKTRLRGVDRGINTLFVLYNKSTKKFKEYGVDTFNKLNDVRLDKERLRKEYKFKQLKGLKGREKNILKGALNQFFYDVFKDSTPLLMEDLSNIKKSFNYKINNWKLSRFPVKKAADKGIHQANKVGTICIFRYKQLPSTKKCSRCGSINVKLKDRKMMCNDCGYIIDRDRNAAYNIADMPKDIPVYVKSQKKDPFSLENFY